MMHGCAVMQVLRGKVH